MCDAEPAAVAAAVVSEAAPLGTLPAGAPPGADPASPRPNAASLKPPGAASPKSFDAASPKSLDAASPASAISERQQQQAAIEAANEPGEEDEFDVTDGYETRSTGSASATSSIYAHTYEHGRRYQCFKNGRYPIPNDDLEQSREDLKHAMLLELLDGELFYAPVGDYPQMILDIGTGTGVWAIDVGDRYPSARVRGIDLSPTQPIWVPPNVDFLVDDCEQDWLARETADLVHFRFMTIVLKDVLTVLKHAYTSLKPGGWIELQELCAEPLCDDGTMTDEDPVKWVYDLAGRAYAKFGMNVTLPKELEPVLHQAGFENVHCVVRKVPIGVWAKDKTLRLVGLYQKMAVLDLMPTLAGRPFEALGMGQTESHVALAHARRGLEDPSVHRYFHYYFWYAQKPLL